MEGNPQETETARACRGPLEGLKVLDLGIVGAGPIGPTLLAELGAEVIKVEMPELGNMLRRFPPLYEGVSLWKPIELRNKRSITVDMHAPEGQALIKELVQEYDIVLENYRPGTLERWNLGYEALKQANERAILVRVSGFGQGGPYSQRTSYDTIGAATGGLTYLNGSPEGPPLLLGIAYCDYISAAFNALAILIADYCRRKTGQGQWAEVTQYEVIFRILEWTVAAYDKLGLVRQRSGNRHASYAPADLFRAADDQWIAIVAGDDKSFARLARAMGQEELREAPRFRSAAQRAENQEAIHRIVAEWVASHPLAGLVERLDRAGVPFSPVYSIREIFDDPHYQARQNLLEMEDPVMGKVKVPNLVPRFSRTPGQVRDTGAALGQHNEEILAGLRARREAMRGTNPAAPPCRAPGPAPVAPGALPLEGLRVLDVGPGLAGPFAGTLLADFGAEVIKVEEPGRGDPLRQLPPFYQGTSLWWAVDGRNKRSITLDLRQPKGQEIFRQLAGLSDGVVESFRPGTLERWGLGYEALKAANHKLILLRVSGFGQEGPYAHRPAYDAVGVAMGGVTYLTGSPDGPPLKPSLSIADYMTGVFGAISLMAALYHRDRSGEGQWIDLALYEPFCRFSQDNIPAYDKLGLVRERLGNLFASTGSQLCYQSQEGDWVVILAAEDKDFSRLTQAMGQPELSKEPRFATLLQRVENRSPLNGIIASWARELKTRELVDLLAAHQVPVSRIYSIQEIFEDPHYRARGNLLEVEDPVLGKVKMQNVIPRFSLTPGKVVHCGPRLGQHNQEILSGRLGYSGEEVARLAEEKVI